MGGQIVRPAKLGAREGVVCEEVWVGLRSDQNLALGLGLLGFRAFKAWGVWGLGGLGPVGFGGFGGQGLGGLGFRHLWDWGLRAIAVRRENKQGSSRLIHTCIHAYMQARMHTHAYISYICPYLVLYQTFQQLQSFAKKRRPR